MIFSISEFKNKRIKEYGLDAKKINNDILVDARLSLLGKMIKKIHQLRNKKKVIWE